MDAPACSIELRTGAFLINIVETKVNPVDEKGVKKHYDVNGEGGSGWFRKVSRNAFGGQPKRSVNSR